MDTQLHSPGRSVRSGKIAFGFKTDVGRKRSNNEDSYAVLTRSELGNKIDGLVVLADGMGGTSGGEIASNIVVNSLPDAVHAFLSERKMEGRPEELAVLLSDSIRRANVNVWNYKAENPKLSNMGTTCVAALVSNDVVWIGNVGDSRAYLLRDGQLTQLTEDHSTVQEEVRAGRMTREDARTSRFRNQITRHIGRDATVQPDIVTRPLREGDVVLLCSDGLSTEVDDPELAQLLASSGDPQEAADLLVERALQNGGSDNVTVVVIHYGVVTPRAMVMPSPLPDEDEDVTDPNQEWKRNLSSRREPNPRGEEPIRERIESGSVGRRSRRRGIAPWLFVLTLLVGMAEAAALYLFWVGTLKPQKMPAPPVPQASVARPTDKPLSYARPITIFAKQPLWENMLLVDAHETTEKLIVLGTDGTVWSITTGGMALVVPSAPVKVPPSVQPGKRVDGSVKPVPVFPVATLDASGNRYQLNPTTRAIDKYDATGTRILPDIGKGMLASPSSIAVDKSGNLYVIDNHQLKKLKAESAALAPPIGTPASSTPIVEPLGQSATPSVAPTRSQPQKTRPESSSQEDTTP